MKNVINYDIIQYYEAIINNGCDNMGSYLVFSRNAFKKKFAFRGTIVLSILGMILYIFVQIALWKYLFKHNESQMTYMISYTILVAITNTFIYNDIAIDMSDLIQTGRYAVTLIKPINPAILMVAKNFGETMASLLTGGIILIVIFCLAGNIEIITISSLLIYIIFIILVHIFISLLFMIIGCLSFVVYRITPFNSIAFLCISFFGGGIVPITFYPKFLLKIIDLLPFKYIYFFPIDILLSDVTNKEILTGMMTIFIWIIFFIVLFKIIYSKTVKKTIVQGG